MNTRRPLVNDTTRYMFNAILIMILIGLVVVLGLGVGYWMMSIWHNS